MMVRAWLFSCSCRPSGTGGFWGGTGNLLTGRGWLLNSASFAWLVAYSS
jgi:hypothetical protein